MSRRNDATFSLSLLWSLFLRTYAVWRILQPAALISFKAIVEFYSIPHANSRIPHQNSTIPQLESKLAPDSILDLQDVRNFKTPEI